MISKLLVLNVFVSYDVFVFIKPWVHVIISVSCSYIVSLNVIFCYDSVILLMIVNTRVFISYDIYLLFWYCFRVNSLFFFVVSFDVWLPNIKIIYTSSYITMTNVSFMLQYIV